MFYWRFLLVACFGGMNNSIDRTFQAIGQVFPANGRSVRQVGRAFQEVDATTPVIGGIFPPTGRGFGVIGRNIPANDRGIEQFYRTT
jgi:hypothetical protein